MATNPSSSPTVVPIAGLLNGQSLQTIQDPFLLTEADYLRLQRGPPITSGAAVFVGSAVIGFAVGLLPKFIASLSGGENLTKYEWYTFAGGCLLTAVIFFVGLAFENESKAVKKKMKEHFEKSKPSHRII